MNKKEYVGDGVYVEWNQYGDLILTTENGLEAQNIIVLEPEVYQRLVQIVTKWRQADEA